MTPDIAPITKKDIAPITKKLIKYQPEEFIVAQQHEAMVVQKLRGLEIEPSSIESSQLLGLARLRLTDIKAAADLVAKAVDNAMEAKSWRETHPKPTSSHIDRLLWGLRALFAAEYAGWTPSLGKNRFVGRVHGVGEVSHGGGGHPTMVAKGTPLPLPPRATGPGRGVRVGVLDTELYAQPWLAGGWTARFSDTFDGHSVPPFAQGHATFVTGLILSQAPGATVEVRSVLGENGEADSWTVAEEIVRFGRTGLDVLNLSFVCYTEDGQPPLVLSAAVDRLDPDLVVVAAAGNHGEIDTDSRYTKLDARKPAWPAALDDVIAVGAARDREGTRANFSPEAPWVDVLALGQDLLSTYLPKARGRGDGNDADRDEEEFVFGDYARWSGTSFAAALVSGAIAAGTNPGRISGREALQDIIDTLKKKSMASGAPANFLPLVTIEPAVIPPNAS